MRFSQALGGLACAIVLVGFAGAQDTSESTINDIRIVGLARINEQLVRSQLEVQVGEPYSPRAVARDIRRLYELGFFTSIKVDATPSGGGLALAYIFEEKRVIDEIKIIGNKKVRDRAIRGVLSWRAGDSFVEDGYNDEREAILGLYETKGLPNTVVDINVEEVGPSRVRITYEIEEGKKARIKNITFEGNEALSDRKLRKTMKTRRRWFMFGGKYDEQLFEEDLNNVVREYGNYGRLEADVVDTDMEFEPGGRGVDITIRVEEGPEYEVGSLEVAGNDVFDDDEVLNAIKVTAGDVHNRGQVEEDAEAIAKGHRDSGYLDIRVAPQVTLDRENKVTNIVYNIEEGQLKYVHEVKITGNNVTRDEVIRREIFLLPGERFDGALLDASRRRLEGTEYFSAVRFSVEDVPDNDHLANLLVDVEEGKTGFFNFGMGYSTEESFGGYAELELNNFDITNFPTFSGGGQQLKLRLHLGSVRNEYYLSFADPEILGYPVLFGFDIFDQSYKYSGASDYTEETTGGRIRLGKVLSPYVTTRLALQYREVNYSDLRIGPLSPFSQYIGGDTTISLIGGINRSNLNSTIDPSRGWKHDLELQIAGVGGDNDFVKLEHDTTWYKSLTREDKWVFSWRTREGFAVPFGDSEFVPLADRFFAGGASTVRGYESRDIGPTRRTFPLIGDEEAIGGEMRVLETVEFKYKINDIVRAYTFADAGGVWETTSDFDTGGMRYSVGVGLGFNIPRIGPIRLDYGIPLNADEDQGSGRLHLQGGFRF